MKPAFSLLPGVAQEIDFFSVADRAGLKPMRSGSRIRFFCPQCGEPGSRKKGRSASAAAEVEGNPWHCFRNSCGASGNARTLAALLGDLDAFSRPRPPRPVPKPAARPFSVALGWQEIVEATTSEGIDRVFLWSSRRGWPGEVAQAVSFSDDVAFVDPREEIGKAGRRIVALAEKVGRRILIPIRDAEGVVRTAARRFDGDGPAPDGPKSLSLPASLVGSSESWGGVLAYGSIPEAIEAASSGAPVYIVEGGPDYLAAVGLLAASGMAGSVLGLFSAQTVESLVRAFVSGLQDRGTIAPRVVVIPHVDRSGVGAKSMAIAAGLLRGRAGVYIVDLSAETPDLSDLLAAKGAPETIAYLRTARCLYPSPVPLREAPREMSARFHRAVIEATQKSSFGRTSLVVFEVPPGVGKSWQALKTSAAIVCGEFSIPVNGAKPRHWPADEPWPPRERSVVYSTADHGLGDEKLEELSELAPGTRARHVYGLLHHCSFSTNVEPVFPAVGRQGVCGRPKDEEQRCEFAATCPGAEDPVAFRGEVTFVPHALVAKLRADLVIIDESPGVVSLEVATDEAVRSLFACKLIPRVLRWRRFKNPDAAEAALLLSDLVSPLASKHAAEASAGEIEPYSRRISGEELLALLSKNPKLLGYLRSGYAEGAASPPVPLPREARSGAHAINHMPSRPAFSVLRSLGAYLDKLAAPPAEEDPLRVLQGDEEERAPVCAVRLDCDGRWSIEVRKVRPLPKAPIVVLDATGDLTLAEWQAAYPDRRVVIRSLEVQGAAPASAVHIESAHFSRRGLLAADGSVREDAVPRIRRVIEDLAARARAARPRLEGDPPVRLGLLTHKPIADALAGQGKPSQVGGGPALRLLLEDLKRRGFEFVNARGRSLLGWFGRHDRGTNEFEAVDGLAVVGDPWANLGDVEADAFLLGLKTDEIATNRAAATCRQAIARARHIRRGPTDRVVLVFAGAKPPEVPGVAWQVDQLRGGAPEDTTTTRLAELLSYVSRVEGAIGLPVLEVFDRTGTPWEDLDVEAIPAARRRRVVKKIAKVLRWVEFRVNNPHGFQTVAAPSAEIAAHWIATRAKPVEAPAERHVFDDDGFPEGPSCDPADDEPFEF